MRWVAVAAFVVSLAACQPPAPPPERKPAGGDMKEATPAKPVSFGVEEEKGGLAVKLYEVESDVWGAAFRFTVRNTTKDKVIRWPLLGSRDVVVKDGAGNVFKVDDTQTWRFHVGAGVSPEKVLHPGETFHDGFACEKLLKAKSDLAVSLVKKGGAVSAVFVVPAGSVTWKY